MKLTTTNIVPYLITLPSLTRAFIEQEPSDASIVTLASFTDPSLSDPATAFFSPHDIVSSSSSSLFFDAPPSSFASDISDREERLGVEAGSIRIDGRSGKIVSLDLKKPILPGDGTGNHLLWSVDAASDTDGDATAEEGGRGTSVDREEWGRLGVEAVKVRRRCDILL